MYYLSIDCANKSLAIGLYHILDIDWKELLLEILQNKKYTNEEKIINSHNLLNTIFNIEYLNVIDLIPDKKVSETEIIERSIELKNQIHIIKEKLKNINEKINVLIEYQMNINDKSRAIYSQLIYAFANIKHYNIFIITPTLKNQIYFKDELKHCRILQKYSKSYTANKVHCKENFLFFLDIFNKKDMVKNIKKKNIDDIADTFMQLIGWLKNGKNN